ncbi:hypothetical protein BFJ68_g17744 [Fusarium oxysporum]|uniref:Zn(2)-C6 fungal-type domain-containing protein n=1 Tax=Fusarium oxysporum TaxID=5507 RepID=A0A420NIK5_FUSOX|nr:hypothetical protein BFJ71_g16041 [Fusarium oxysporum]RKK80141.1 hypothetical protein BFJ68_g17744 [Fusarium oxysporum]
MAPLEPQQPPRKKWTRAKVPRVRTGCKTWYAIIFEVLTRHLKCDEQKPVCQRCLKDKQRCDGYEDPNALIAKAKEPLKLVSKPKRPTSRALSALRPALSVENLGSPADAALFNHARECTIMDFDVLSGSLFWRNFVLPLAHTVEPVKHALCALGGAHRRFVAGYQGEASLSLIAAEFEFASIQKYNQAILHMKPLMEDNSEVNFQITLICCVIFICIESMHGRYTESIRHLKAGCQLLNSVHAERKFGYGPSSLLQPTDVKEAEYSLIDLVAEMLHRLRQNVAIYMGSGRLHDLILPLRAGHMGDPETPFSNLVEAAFYLDRMGEFEFVSDHQLIRLLGMSCMGVTGWEFDHQARKAALDAARRAIAVWGARYELTKREGRYSKPSSGEKSAFASLDMHQAVWWALVKLETIEQVIPKEDGEKILQRAEVLIKIENRRRTPVFAFNGYLLPLLSLVCTHCEDVDTQSRAVSLLRTVRRREGIWDSQEVAGIYETMIIARKQNMVTWENLPLGIPQLAAELSSLRLSESGGSTPSNQ